MSQIQLIDPAEIRSKKLLNAYRILQREKEWIQENERCQYYQPNEPIERFVRLIGTTDNLVYILSAANAIGKTCGLVNLAASVIWGPQNRWFDHPKFKNWPYEKRIRFVSEPSQVKESGPLPSEIKKWWPKGKYQAFKGGQHYVSEYKAGDWIFEVMTYEQAAEQHEGANLGLVLFNEPPPQNLWTPNISRLRTGGFAVVGMTPLTEAGWFFDDVVPRHEDFIVYADVEKACKEHSVRGHLSHDQIQKMIQEYNSEEREARIEGKAMYLKGLIFKTFNPQIHVLKETVMPPANATIYQVVDPHSDKPFAIIWAFVDGRGDLYIYDEWPNQDFYKWRSCQLTIPDYVNIFRDKEQGYSVHKRIIDRRFAEVAHITGTTRRTLRDEFMDVGIDFYPNATAHEEVETGIEGVRRYLKYNPDRPMDVMNKPKLFINPHCFNTIKSLGRWSRDPKNGKVQEEFKDFCDVVRYLVADDPKVDVPAPYTAPKRMY